MKEQTKNKSQNYATISLGPDKEGQDRRQAFYRAAKEAKMSFSAWIIDLAETSLKSSPR